MPELPEVEAARENLERWLAGKAIRSARVLDPLMARGQDPRRVEAALRGARVRGIARRAKYLIWDLGRRGRVLSHLGMTGKFVLRRAGGEEPRWVRAAIELGGGRRVLYVDPRRLGRFQILDASGERRLAELGVEPLSREFTPALLGSLLESSRLPLKLFLMDQGKVAGLGNIQANEALFLARLHPSIAANRVSPPEARRLHRAILRSLRDSLKDSRAPEITYVEEPGAPNPFRIYGRQGEPCPGCRGKIARIVQGGRSSYFCPRCQRLQGRTAASSPGPRR